MGTIQFEKIYHGLSPETGSKCNFLDTCQKTTLITIAGVRVAASGMAWKAVDSEKVVTVAASAIKSAQWLRVARNYQLRVGTSVENKNSSKEQRKEKFDGFQREVGHETSAWNRKII